MKANKWDVRFIDMAKLVASWSKDPSTKCGAVIVRPDKTVASVGFNGFPKGCEDSSAYYEDRPSKLARVVHAEVNAILHAHEPVKGYSIYTYQDPMIGPSCANCSACIIQAGIAEVVYPQIVFNERWKESLEQGLEMYKEAGVQVVGVEL